MFVWYFVEFEIKRFQSYSIQLAV